MASTVRNRFLLGLGLFLLAFLPRLAYIFLVQSQHWNGQDAEMDRAACNIVREGWIGNVFGPDTGPTAHVAPLYTYWLAIWYGLFGPATFAAHFAQSLFSTTAVSLSIALLPELGRKLRLPAGPTLVAAVAWALFSFNFYIETTGCWEQPVVPLVLIGVVMLFGTLHERGWQSTSLILSGGCFVGLAALFSPALLPVVGGLLAVELVQARAGRWRLLKPMAVFVLVALVCVAPWTYRNYRVLGGFVPVRSNFGLELAIGNSPSANGQTYCLKGDEKNCSLFQMHPYQSLEARARLGEIGELAFMKEKQDEAKAWIAAHPARFAELTLARFRYYWFPTGLMWAKTETDLGLGLELKAAFFSLVTLGCFGWLAYSLWQRLPYRWTLLILILGPSLTNMITHVELRYRYPVFGFTLLLCCQFVFHFFGPAAMRLLAFSRSWQKHAAELTLHPFAASR